MANGKNGMDEKISVIRISSVSIAPPKYPDIHPTKTPIMSETSTATLPIVSVILPPCTIRANTSRPLPSVPIKYPFNPAFSVNRPFFTT